MVAGLASTSVSPTDKIIINGTTLTLNGGSGQGTAADIVSSINGKVSNVTAALNVASRLVITGFGVPLTLSQPSGFTTLAKLGLNAGTFYAPTAPLAFATAYGEAGAGPVKLTDQISINGATVTLNQGTGTAADVVAAINATNVPNVRAFVRNGAPYALVAIRNTAGGTLTLADVTGTPLETLGIAAATYQPGGYSAGVQNALMIGRDALAAQGRGVYVGGSSFTDRSIWPHAPLEARGAFLHGVRSDHASFGDGNAVLLGSGQGVGWTNGTAIASITGSGTGANQDIVVTPSGSGLLRAPTPPQGDSSNAVATTAFVQSSVVAASGVPTKTSQLTNDSGFITGNQSITFTGDATGTGSTSVALTLKNTGTAGIYTKVTTDAQGRVTAGGSVAASDVTAALGFTPALAGGAQVFTASGTWTKNANATMVMVEVWGGGGGGGAGAVAAASTACSGGGGGGAGLRATSMFRASDLPATVAVTVGAAGAAGTTAGTAGGVGGTSSFGTLLYGFGGGSGAGGQASANAAGGTSAGTNGSAAASSGVTAGSSGYFASTGGTSGSGTSTSAFGMGSGGGAGVSGAAGSTPGYSWLGAQGGGGGGGISAANASFAGANAPFTAANGMGSTGGAAGGGSATAPGFVFTPGSPRSAGGAGGGANVGGNGGNGYAGQTPGGGGGGGGSTQTGYTQGSGGAGGGGMIIVWQW
jgi:hypothetical protein